MIHPIQYNIILGERTMGGSLFVLEELIDDKIYSIGYYPQTLEHLVMGCDYSQLLLNTGERAGYLVAFVYADSVDMVCPLPVADPDGIIVQVYLICTKDPACLDRIAAALKNKHNGNCIYVVDEFQKAWINWNNVFIDNKDVILYLKQLAPKFIDFSLVQKPYDVPEVAKEIDRGYTFNPTVVNTLIGQSYLGNWLFAPNIHTAEEKVEESQRAINEKDTFNRQQILIDQIKKLNAIENVSLYPHHRLKLTTEAVKSPIVIVLPFTSSDIRKRYTKDRLPGFTQQQKVIAYALRQKTNKNYTVDLPTSEEGINPIELSLAYRVLYSDRSRFLDIVGLLHSSLRFSPFLRLPIQGVDINRELAFFAPAISENLCNAKDKNSIENTMLDLGRKIVENTLSAEAQEMLKLCPKQLVAITDLPIEWIPIDDIPLGFTHDICRLPEFPLEGNLMHYVINTIQRVVVPKDVIKRTLVVYGTRSESFKHYQDMCDDLAERLGFHTAVCLNKKQFFEEINKHKPFFLIVDSHGNYNSDNHQTYLRMGDEELYPQDIVDNKVQVPLVFLSACNTAPTYHSVNTLANGFVQSGSLSVTSSYLPLSVGESSTVYLRLLRQLSEASQKSIHKNWLSFVSHILRTSYIHAAFMEYYAKTKRNIMDVAGPNTRYLTRSMVFQERRSVYEELKQGFDEEGIHIQTAYKVPHYLMYSTIGRADLINFESFMDENTEELLKSVSKEAPK